MKDLQNLDDIARNCLTDLANLLKEDIIANNFWNLLVAK